MKANATEMNLQAGYPIAVLILSDNHIIRSGLRRILESQPNFHVIGELSIEKAHRMEAIAGQHANLVIIDLDPRSANALPVISTLQKGPRNSAVLALIDLSDHELGTKALSLGASGLVLKMQPASVLLATIYELFPPYEVASITKSDPIDIGKPKKQKKWGANLSNAVATKPESDSARIANLTTRELEVVRLIALGLKNKDIAKRLAISDITVRHHLTSIFCKLEVSDRQNLLILAHRHGLADLGLGAESA